MSVRRQSIGSSRLERAILVSCGALELQYYNRKVGHI